MIYLLTAFRLTPGGSSTVHICTQTVHRTTQLASLVGRLSGIRTQSCKNVSLLCSITYVCIFWESSEISCLTRCTRQSNL